MREFQDDEGGTWVAQVAEREGPDYKGRFHVTLVPAAGADGGGDAVALDDVRWNSERTARRTLETMADVELRRRLRSALGRTRPRSVNPAE